MGEIIKGLGVCLINTPAIDGEAMEGKAEMLKVAEATGFFNEEGIPLHTLETAVEANGNIRFSFNGKALGVFYAPKGGEYMDKAQAVSMAKDPSKTFAVVGEDGRRLKIEVFDTLALRKAKGEEVSALDMTELGSVEEVKQNLIAGGSPLSESEIDERISHMKTNKVSDKNIKYVLTQELSKVKKADEVIPRPPMPFKEPAPAPDMFGNMTENGILNRVISAFRLGQHIILDGPKGTGKDVCLETVSWLTCRPFISHTMTMDISKEDLLGDYITDNSRISLSKHPRLLGSIGAGLKALFGKPEEAEDTINLMAEVFKPRVVFEPSSVVTALRTGRCILNLDEMNLAQTGVLSGVVNTIADNHSSYIYVRGLGKVAITGETIVTATMNGLDCDYDGTQPLNEATDDRFKTIRFSNPTGSVMDILMGLNTGATTPDLMLVDNLYQAIRDMYVTGVDGVAGAITSKAVSMRACRRMLLDLADGVSPYEAFRDNFLNKLTVDEASIIYQVVTTKGIIPLPH